MCKYLGKNTQLNRQYSLSVAPGREYFRISVKKEKDFEPNGKVSNYLHDHVSVGDQIEVSAPAGDFHLVEEEMAPIALISGGVGLTPMMSMLDTLVQSDTDRAVTFIHSARNEEVHAFAKDAENLVKQLKKGTYYYGYEKPTNPDGDHHFIGYITEEFLKDKIANNTVCYVCGPVPFLKNIVQMLANIGVSKENIRYEFFGPAMEITKETAAV